MKNKRITIYVINTILNKCILKKRILNDNRVKQRINETQVKFNKQPNIIFKLSL